VKSQKDIRSLTGIRGISAIYVVLHHYFGTGTFGNMGETFLTHGYLAVDLFFILSGFVMTLTYQHMFAKGFSVAGYMTFMGRRVARIYPIYIISTLVGLALILLGLNDNIKADVSSPAVWAFKTLLNSLLVQGWGLTGSINDPTWSLSAEWAAYLLFPVLLMPCLFGKAKSAWLTLFLCLGDIAILCIAHLPFRSREGLLDITAYHYGMTLFRCLPEFCLGILAFRASSTPFGRYLRSNSFISPVICLAILLLLPIPKTDFLIVLLVPLLIITLASGAGHVPGKLLSSPLAYGLGLLSYSIYLIHTLASAVITPISHKLAQLGFHNSLFLGKIAALILSLALAAFSYHYIEKPGRDMFRTLFEGRKQSRVEAAPAT
jgi:peptidoglycan/LPS O-acetylase OafA/YrhL